MQKLENELIEALEGCEKYSSDADFEALGAIVYRNRKLLLAALSARLETEAECAEFLVDKVSYDKS